MHICKPFSLILISSSSKAADSWTFSFEPVDNQ
ncbi:hypothetical protein [Plasmodium yoelii yoelii]|uniref:Uncharacterized protein n=1 Tax=Plasmodium yoelii yoelii TaxID=73239 RepID=Q7RBV0_PLAYO|nr:hypothetical protein [Plasmodium yoelii yoelii]